MRYGAKNELPLLLFSYLWRYSDASHHLSMPELQAMLEEEDITADRRTIGYAIKAIDAVLCPVHFTRANKQGYYIDHLFTESEALFISGLIAQAPGISASLTDDLLRRLQETVSQAQKEQLHMPAVPSAKSDNENVLKQCETILSAIKARHAIEFHYYDRTVTKQKRYRKNRHRYTQIPYAVILHQGRFYAVCYSMHHGNFANYRIDRMDHITESDTVYDPVPFDLESYSRSTFDMYKGDLRTITLRCALSLSEYVQDAFGDHLLIQAIDEDSFTFSVSTALTPTLTSWLLQYYDRCTVIAPEELQNNLIQIAETILSAYNKSKEETHHE